MSDYLSIKKTIKKTPMKILEKKFQKENRQHARFILGKIAADDVQAFSCCYYIEYGSFSHILLIIETLIDIIQYTVQCRALKVLEYILTSTQITIRSGNVYDIKSLGDPYFETLMFRAINKDPNRFKCLGEYVDVKDEVETFI